ncbi:hypothetical protein [Amycolatopsis sp. cmx-11-12]|uniref:hypothetical protein n=1 Tax=Amycolatopsis sp. cmx-11-12 TaxID=2785795 RepID=UPI0039180D67
MLRRIILIAVLLLASLTVTTANATAAENCVEKSLVANAGYNKANTKLCLELVGGKRRAKLRADCYYYWGAHWSGDKPCTAKVEFLVVVTYEDESKFFPTNLKSAKTTDNIYLSGVSNLYTCKSPPSDVQSVTVHMGLKWQQYWNEQNYGTLSLTLRNGGC